jgi:uncharacterized membrane protein
MTKMVKISMGASVTGLLLLAVAVRVAYILTVAPADLRWKDEQVYDRIAWRLAETGRFESNPDEAAPALPASLALVYKCFGHSYVAARLVQAILGGVLVLAIYGTGLCLFDRPTATLAALGVALYPQLIYLSSVFYAEHLFAVLLAVTIFCLARWQGQGVRWLVAGGVTLGLGALCRPVGLAVVPFVAAYVVWRAPVGRRLVMGAAIVAATALTILPWTMRNAVVFHRFVPVATGYGVQLWRGNNDLARGDADDRHLVPLNSLWQERAAALPEARRVKVTQEATQLLDDLKALPPVDHDRRMMVEGWRWLRAHPGRFIALSARRLVTLYSAFTRTMTENEAANRWSRLVAAVSFYPVLALGLAGFVVAWRRNPASWIIPAVIAGVTLAYLPATACTRFRLPVDAFWILLASVTVTGVWRRRTNTN